MARWLTGFHDRHGVARTAVTPYGTDFHGADGAVAQCHLPFGPPPEAGEWAEFRPDPLVERAGREYRVGVLLVRLGGYAAGVFEGDRLVSSKVDSRLVHGRHKKGGSSQHRFARRREGEVRQVVEAATGIAVRILLPQVAGLDAVVLGGDRRAVDLVLADRLLAPVAAKVTDRFLTVPDPRLAVLEETPATFRAVRVRLLEPSP
jgi:hypothetical protein